MQRLICRYLLNFLHKAVIPSAKIFSLTSSENDENKNDMEIEDKHVGPMVQVQKEYFKEALVSCIDTLPEREKLVMSLYYEEELNLQEIGEVLSVNESRVCQIHGEALVRIRGRMREWLDDDQELMMDN